jgi:hypothetical protein
MVQKNRPVGDTAEQIKPQVAAFFRQNSVDFHVSRFRREVSVEVRAAGRQSPSWPGKIVTGRLNEYTIPEDVTSKGRRISDSDSGRGIPAFPGCFDPPDCSSKGSDRP